jgi:hypothetical protein
MRTTTLPLSPSLLRSDVSATCQGVAVRRFGVGRSDASVAYVAGNQEVEQGQQIVGQRAGHSIRLVEGREKRPLTSVVEQCHESARGQVLQRILPEGYGRLTNGRHERGIPKHAHQPVERVGRCHDRPQPGQRMTTFVVFSPVEIPKPPLVRLKPQREPRQAIVHLRFGVAVACFQRPTGGSIGRESPSLPDGFLLAQIGQSGGVGGWRNQIRVHPDEVYGTVRLLDFTSKIRPLNRCETN